SRAYTHFPYTTLFRSGLGVENLPKALIERDLELHIVIIIGQGVDGFFVIMDGAFGLERFVGMTGGKAVPLHRTNHIGSKGIMTRSEEHTSELQSRENI